MHVYARCSALGGWAPTATPGNVRRGVLLAQPFSPELFLQSERVSVVCDAAQCSCCSSLRYYWPARPAVDEIFHARLFTCPCISCIAIPTKPELTLAPDYYSSLTHAELDWAGCKWNASMRAIADLRYKLSYMLPGAKHTLALRPLTLTQVAGAYLSLCSAPPAGLTCPGSTPPPARPPALGGPVAWACSRTQLSPPPAAAQCTPP